MLRHKFFIHNNIDLTKLYNLSLEKAWLVDIEKCSIPVNKKYAKGDITNKSLLLVEEKFIKFPIFQQNSSFDSKSTLKIGVENFCHLEWNQRSSLIQRRSVIYGRSLPSVEMTASH